MKLFSLLLLSLFIVSCSVNSESKRSIQESYNKVSEQKAVFIDVRELDEVNEGMVRGALWIPLSSINENKSLIENLKIQAQGKEIFVYCRSGKRSQIFVNALKENGISSQNIGGFNDLVSSGLPTQEKP